MTDNDTDTDNLNGEARGDQPSRPVDAAMDQERSEKQAIRNLWLHEVQFYSDRYPTDQVPLYLTLSGVQARDIRLLIDHNIIQVTEGGAIASDAQGRVVAIERSSKGEVDLRKNFPGLRVLNNDFKAIIGGDSDLYPII